MGFLIMKASQGIASLIVLGAFAIGLIMVGKFVYKGLTKEKK